MIVMAVNEVFEIGAMMICLNYLNDRKYRQSVWDAVIFVAELTLVEIIKYFDLDTMLTFLGYVLFYIYSILKFRNASGKAFMDALLVILLGVLFQLVCSLPLLLLEGRVSMDSLVVFSNMVMFAVMLWLGKKGYLLQISNYVMRRGWIVTVSYVLCLVGVIYLWILYKFVDSLRITDYYIYGSLMLLLGVVLINWQKTRDENIARKKEMELHNIYDSVYEDLLESVRKRQHEFNNHITVLFSQHYLATDMEDLIARQKSYSQDVLYDNRYNKLLASGSPVVVGLLYSKFLKAEEAGCRVTYDVRVLKLAGRVPQYRLVEIIGVLLDNALEAAVSEEEPAVDFSLLERERFILIRVGNTHSPVSQSEFAMFFQSGYSTKGEGRGLGLARVKDLLLQYEAEIEFYNQEREGRNYVVAEMRIPR